MAMTIEEGIELYLVQLRADGRSRHTLAQAARHLGSLARYLPEHRLAEVSHEDVARFFGSPRATSRADGRPKKATSVNSLRSSVRAFFRYARDAGLVVHDASRLLRRARTGVAPPRGLSGGERERLVAALVEGKGAAAERDRVLFALMLATGIRIGSALGLDVGDLDLEEGTLLLRRVKGGSQQVVFVPGRVVEALRGFVGARREGPLFCGVRGQRVGARQVHRRLAEWCRRAGLGRRVSPHALRHTFALGLYERTGDVLLVQAALGHRSILSTTVYASAAGARVREAVVAG